MIKVKTNDGSTYTYHKGEEGEKPASGRKIVIDFDTQNGFFIVTFLRGGVRHSHMFPLTSIVVVKTSE